MQSSLIPIKLKAPPAAQHLVLRERLLDALDLGVPACKLALVCAPAGYGKTTLISHWARTTALRVGWLTVDAADNDVERFLRYLYAAWERIEPDIRRTDLGLLLDGMMPNIEAVMAAFINVADDRADHVVLVVDDYQLVVEPTIHEAMTFLIDHLPESLSFVIASRDEPPLSLARYRARQELLELRADDLRFVRDETDAFVNQQLGLGLSGTDVESLQRQTEGWIAGLQLASLTLRGDERLSPAAISGRHRFIADFLRNDVLARLSDETQQFLIRTSFVERLCGSLCDAITTRSDGQEMLETLERQNLFTMPLDDVREWFRYHGLFADLLRDELSRHTQDERNELHRRAAAWYLDHAMPEQAFDHGIAASDTALTTQVFERYGRAKLFSGQVTTLLGWNNAIPNTWLAIEPMLGIFRSAVLFATGQVDACTRSLGDVEHAIRSAGREMPAVQARVTAVRCFIACALNELEQAESLADEALKTLPPADESFRGDVYNSLGDTYRRNGYWTHAHRSYLRALDRGDDPGSYVQSAHTFGALADLALRQGKLREAAGYWHRALAVLNNQQTWGAYPLPLIGWVHIRLGEILYEWNDLEAARECVEQGRERAELGGDPRSIIAAGLLEARILMARGEGDAAEAHIERLRPIVAETQFPEWSSEFERRQVEFWIAQGRLRSAVTWSDEMLARDAVGLPDREPIQLAIVHVLVVKGDAASSERALELLAGLIGAADTEGRTGVRIEALALQAVAHWNRGVHASALTSLEHTLRLAEPEGFARLFIDLGRPVGRVLQEARRRNTVVPEYVDRLLSGFTDDTVARPPSHTFLPEPLSERELDVLQKTAVGLTNREIADALFISPETVKKHTSSIYGKLGVRSRMEAVSRCRDLDLLN